MSREIEISAKYTVTVQVNISGGNMKKRFFIMFLIGLTASMLLACGKKEEVVKEAEIPVAEEAPAEEPSEAEEDAEEEKSGSFSRLYLKQIDELFASGKADQFALIDVDGDDVPELCASNSEGPCEESVFLYTYYDNDVLLLESGIAGFDGYNIWFSEGKNLIRTGSSMGGYNTDEYKSIEDGKLKEVFTAQEIGIDDEESYSINGKEMSEKEYNTALWTFISEYDPFMEIGYDSLNRITYKYEDDTVSFERSQDDADYLDYNGIKDRLTK